MAQKQRIKKYKFGCCIISSAVGILVGGYIIKRFKVKESCAKATKLCAVFSGLTLVGGAAWFVPGCGEVDLAGVTALYRNR